MPYQRVEDIHNLETLQFDFRKINPLMHEVITTTRIALAQPYNLKKRVKYEGELCSYLRNQLLLHSTTHASIHVLMKFFHQKDSYPAIVDAASLSREQIERIFSIALVVRNPHRWVRQELRGAWRKNLETYLLALEEHGANPRYERYLNKDFVEYLKQGQRPPYGERETLISDLARRTLTEYWKNPGAKNPPWFKKKQSIRNYVADYFQFPTPGKAVTYIQGKSIRRFLYRWHKEYSYFSQFTHLGLEKSMIPFMSESRNFWVRKNLDVAAQLLMERIFFTSFTAAASSCTLILERVRDSYGARPYLIEFWKELYESSLFSKAVWNIYPKRVLK